MVAGLFTTCLLTLLLPVIVLAGPHGPALINRHHGLARRAEGNVQLLQRQGNQRFSFYNTETGSAGSCGKFLSNSGFTVAVNAAQMQASFCGKTITISYGGKTTTATVEDTCPGCPPYGLDMSPALFSFFAPQSIGIIYGLWSFADAAPPAPSPTPTPTPTPPPPSPSPSPYVPPIPSPPSISIPSISTPVWSSSSSSYTSTSTHTYTSTRNITAALASSSSTATSSSTINYNSGAASGLAEPTGSGSPVVTPGTGDNIQNLFQAFIAFAGLITAAHNG